MQKLRFFLIVCALLIGSNLLFGHSVSAANKRHLPLNPPDTAKKNRNPNTNDLLKSYLEFSAFRHKVLSENIANINTPNYKAEDVSVPQKYEDLVSAKAGASDRVFLATTNNHHIAGSATSSKKSRFTSRKIKDPYEIKPNGNNVSLAQQMTKLSRNQSDYNTAVKSYSTTNALISAVLGK